MTTVFKPIIRWAQNKEWLFLTLELTDVQYPAIELTSTRLVFQGFGHGARGEQQYHVDINFYKPVDVSASTHKVLDRHVKFSIAKVSGEQEFWPRLLGDEQKPAWLKIDFDRWQSEDASDTDHEELQNQAEVERFMEASDARELELEDAIDETKEEVLRFVRVFYLIIYNLMQAGLFLYIVLVLLSRLFFHGTDAFADAYDAVSDVLASCQLAAILEVVNPMLGIVKTGVMAPFMQVFGRNMVLFLVVVAHKELHEQAVVYGLFLVWSLIEVVRYPFYASQVINKRIEPLIWLRYTMWIPLYPLGIFFEGTLIWRAIPLLEKSERFSIRLPNAFNFSFSFAWFLRVYLVLLIAGGWYMMKHMYILRWRRYGRRKRKIR
ncbi:very-long-chain (3R)-3-hydroxyacyl-CoA dehydratase-like [Porites lutea]|uniref:very-long-chain (3R)-3-hydroxyacyl-CoA dehydratase-like n=1 Tax=Porites lutea TaxID=51062 RepID=UPI003CC5E438